jgi:hypothetical protein
VRLVPIFYFLRFENPTTWKAVSPYLYPKEQNAQFYLKALSGSAPEAQELILTIPQGIVRISSCAYRDRTTCTHCLGDGWTSESVSTLWSRKNNCLCRELNHNFIWSILWNKIWQGKPKYSEEVFPSSTSSTANPT